MRKGFHYNFRNGAPGKTLMALFLIFIFSVFPLFAQARFVVDNSNRRKINFNYNWKFYLGTPSGSPESINYNDSPWETVNLPHTLKLTTKTCDNSTDDNVQESFHRLTGWYRKHFSISPDFQDRKVFIEFEGVMQVCAVYVNGSLVGRYEVCGYNPFHYDITGFVTFDENDNVLAVFVDNTINGDIPPDTHHPPDPDNWQNGLDFVLFGGIYRDVYLTITDKMYVTFPWDTIEGGITITTTPATSGSKPPVRVKTMIRNENTSPKDINLVTTIIDKNDNVVSTLTTPATLPANSYYLVRQTLPEISNQNLWSPDNPYLYRCYTSIREGSTPQEGIDGITTKFGIRWFTYDKRRGFFLNDKYMQLFGVNRHQTWPWVGNAVPNTVHAREAAQIKSIGANYIRLSHYPHDPSFLDAMDSLGILGLSEAPTWYPHPGTEVGTLWRKNCLKSFRHMIRRDRNHPCIFIYNACINHGDCESDIAAAAHEEDSTRNTGATNPSATNGCDELIIMSFVDHHSAVEDGLLGIEHTGHEFLTSRIMKISGGGSENRLVEHAMKWASRTSDFKGNPEAYGTAGWAMYDYNAFLNDGQINDHDNNITYHGIADLFRLPKFAYYWHISEFTTEPMVFIANYWRDNSPRNPVTVFSNCETVELFVNNVSQGIQQPTTAFYPNLDHPLFRFPNITYQAGELKAVGKKDGTEVTHIVKTPGAVSALVLEVDPPVLVADGADFARIIASVVDNNGTRVPTGVNYDYVTFSLSGQGEFIGEKTIAAPDGWIIGLAKATLKPGVITINASIKDKPAITETITITVIAGPSHDTINTLPEVTAITGGPNGLVSGPVISSKPVLSIVQNGKIQVPYSYGDKIRKIGVFDLRGRRIVRVKARGGSVINVAKLTGRRGANILLIKPE